LPKSRAENDGRSVPGYHPKFSAATVANNEPKKTGVGAGRVCGALRDGNRELARQMKG
jgi:hypothetical protein